VLYTIQDAPYVVVAAKEFHMNIITPGLTTNGTDGTYSSLLVGSELDSSQPDENATANPINATAISFFIATS
jgi:hypothetical protein